MILYTVKEGNMFAPYIKFSKQISKMKVNTLDSGKQIVHKLGKLLTFACVQFGVLHITHRRLDQFRIKTLNE